MSVISVFVTKYIYVYNLCINVKLQIFDYLYSDRNKWNYQHLFTNELFFADANISGYSCSWISISLSKYIYYHIFTDMHLYTLVLVCFVVVIVIKPVGQLQWNTLIIKTFEPRLFLLIQYKHNYVIQYILPFFKECKVWFNGYFAVISNILNGSRDTHCVHVYKYVCLCIFRCYI